jgi:hypothetical protein
MREVVFRFVVERPGHLEARSDIPVLQISAPSLEELHHEAQEALIEHFGPAHCAYRVRILRRQSQRVSVQRVSGIWPLRRLPAPCS